MLVMMEVIVLTISMGPWSHEMDPWRMVHVASSDCVAAVLGSGNGHYSSCPLCDAPNENALAGLTVLES